MLRASMAKNDTQFIRSEAQTWAVIRSQRFLKLEGKSFHTSLFFVSLFVLTFVRPHCVYCVGALSIILHIIIVVVAVALQSVGWCDDAYLVRVTVLHRTCCWWYGCRCRHRACGSYERNNAQKKIKSEQNVEEEKMSWGSGYGLWPTQKRKTTDIGNCRGVMLWSIRDFLFSLSRSSAFRYLVSFNILYKYFVVLSFSPSFWFTTFRSFLCRFSRVSLFGSMNQLIIVWQPVCMYSKERGKHFTHSIIKREEEKYEQKCMQHGWSLWAKWAFECVVRVQFPWNSVVNETL